MWNIIFYHIPNLLYYNRFTLIITSALLFAFLIAAINKIYNSTKKTPKRQQKDKPFGLPILFFVFHSPTPCVSNNMYNMSFLNMLPLLLYSIGCSNLCLLLYQMLPWLTPPNLMYCQILSLSHPHV